MSMVAVGRVVRRRHRGVIFIVLRTGFVLSVVCGIVGERLRHQAVGPGREVHPAHELVALGIEKFDDVGYRAAIVGSLVMIRAVLWDFGGVILSSPFEAFNRYEAELGIPPGSIRVTGLPEAPEGTKIDRVDVIVRTR